MRWHRATFNLRTAPKVRATEFAAELVVAPQVQWATWAERSAASGVTHRSDAADPMLARVPSDSLCGLGSQGFVRCSIRKSQSSAVKAQACAQF